MTSEQIAVAWMVEQIREGGEFPDVLYKASKRFSFSEEELKAEYDLLPTMVQIHAAFRYMERTGGSFASALAQAWFCADSDNRQRIETTWADLIKKYLPS